MAAFFRGSNLDVSQINLPATPGPQLKVATVQQQWPRLTDSDIRNYTEIFLKLDKDNDGKITSEEAHNLFLSWKLTREFIKQVWDLSDQDNDSMLSLREFCIALYLMERDNAKCPLPSVLPSHIMYDLLQGGFGHTAWGYPNGPQQLVRPDFGQLPPTRPPSGRPPLPVPATYADNREQPIEQRTKVPVLEKHQVGQLSEGEQKSLNSKLQEATEANKKVEELEKDIKETRKEMEIYRARMQELVLYKSRCDIRLNETTARVLADKHEVELFAKKYEEKYKQIGDVASRLTIEEATFRDIRERKMELHRELVKLDQDGSTDESLKARVEQLQSSLEELTKTLNERSKTYGLSAKPTTLVELPFGWQPGIQAGSVDWDEDWDKFEDEGFTSIKELTLDSKNLVVPPKTKSKPANKGKSVIEESGKDPASSDAEAKTKKADTVFKEGNGSENEHACAFEKRSPMGSPVTKSSHESPLKEFQDASPFANETTSDYKGSKSSFSGYKSFDEPSWGTFDNYDDADSIWGANPVISSEGIEDDDLFGAGSSSLNPIKTGSKFVDSGFLKKSSSIFADSIRSSPFNDEHLPSFDSFRSTDSGFHPHQGLSRFDSIDYEYGNGLPIYDDSDPFGSGPLRPVDPYGAGPSKSSLGDQTPNKWTAF